MIYLAVHHLKHIKRLIEDYKKITASAAQAVAQAQSGTQKEKSDESSESSSGVSTSSTKDVSKTNISKETQEEKNNETQQQNTTEKYGDENTASSTNRTSAAEKSESSIASIAAVAASVTSTTSLSASSSNTQHTEEPWILPEVEKLLLLVSKVFLLNFPLYIAYKHGTHARLDDISAEEAQHLSIFCDLHDNEIPVYLLRNTSLFCNSNGFAAMILCFDQPDLPVTTAHAITATVSNIKLWLHYGCIVQLFVPLRSKILQYMCKLSDQNLRTTATRAMADFVWSAVRDPLDASVNFDEEGLALAFKYFTSTTLTMRLAGNY